MNADVIKIDAAAVIDTTGRAPAGLEQNGISSQAGGKIFSDTLFRDEKVKDWSGFSV